MSYYGVGLIGFGRMGKIYFKEIKKLKEFKIIDILKKSHILKKKNAIDNFFNLKNIDLIIITSPINTHFEYLVKAHKFNKNVIIEKPFVENNNQLKEILKIYKNYKKKIMIHHNDIFNLDNSDFFNSFNKRIIKKIHMTYGKRSLEFDYKKPIIDWLPHPISIIIKYFGRPHKFHIKQYSRKIFKNKILEKLEIQFDLKSIKAIVLFSNNFSTPKKKIILFRNKQSQVYDGYDNKNQKTVELLLKKFMSDGATNDLTHIKEVYNLLFKIERSIKEFNY